MNFIVFFLISDIWSKNYLPYCENIPDSIINFEIAEIWEWEKLDGFSVYS